MVAIITSAFWELWGLMNVSELSTTTTAAGLAGGVHGALIHLATASSDRRHYRNTITVLDGGSFFLEVADIVVVEVNIHKRPQFTFFSVKVAAQVRMPGGQIRQGVTYCAALDLHVRLLASVLA
jgi:hypothetical protein